MHIIFRCNNSVSISRTNILNNEVRILIKMDLNKIAEILKYKDIEELSVENKIKIFGWLSDSLTRENSETTIEMHEDKIKRIKKFKEIRDSSSD